jgi:hypothetical protein
MRPIAVVRREQKDMEAAGKRLKERIATYEYAKKRRDEAAMDEVQAYVEIGEELMACKQALRQARDRETAVLQWLQWLAQYYPHSARTAQRCMQITTWVKDPANASHVADLNSVAALARAAGVETRARAGEAREFVFTFQVAKRLLTAIEQVKPDDILKLTPIELQTLRQPLEHAHHLYLSLPDTASPRGQ